MYFFSPSKYCNRAIREERFGSYSSDKTLAGMPAFSRPKSIKRYWRLWPAPRWRLVIRPYILRPPVDFKATTRDFSGAFLVKFSPTMAVIARRPAEVGL